ncbi:MAG: kelch repeat-containing protein [Chloroflexi bacterium]|nr:kelch repeat-containing protein [Chloroflexota bacterium]
MGVVSALTALCPAPAIGQERATIWAERAPLPVPNSEIAVAELDGRIYVIGGYPSTRVYVDSVEVYDSESDQWWFAKPVPQPLHHTMAASVNGKLYVIGGEISPTGVANQSLYLNTVYEYDPQSDSWIGKAAMPTERSGGSAAVIGGRIYVAGGRPPHGHDFAVYEPLLDRWTVLPDVPTQRNHLAAAAIGGKFYLAGGRFGGGVGSEMTDRLEVFNPSTNEWSVAAPMLEVRAGLNGVAARGCFYTFGGEGNDPNPRGVFPNNEVYDPRSDSWQKLEAIPIPVHGVTGAAYLDGWIHLPGGGTSRGGNSGSTLHQVFEAVVSCE